MTFSSFNQGIPNESLIFTQLKRYLFVRGCHENTNKKTCKKGLSPILRPVFNENHPLFYALKVTMAATGIATQ